MAGRNKKIDTIDLELFWSLVMKYYVGEVSQIEMCKQLHISQPTLYKYWNELEQRCLALFGRVE